MAEDSHQLKIELMRKVKVDIRGILISASLQGLSISELQRDYLSLNGRDLPLNYLGFYTLWEMLEAIPDVVDNREGRLFPVTTAKTKDLLETVLQQKPAKVGRMGGIVPNNILSDKVRDNVFNMLSELGSGVELPLEQLERGYLERHGDRLSAIAKKYSGESLDKFLEHQLSSLIRLRRHEDGKLFLSRLPFLEGQESCEKEKEVETAAGVEEEAEDFYDAADCILALLFVCDPDFIEEGQLTKAMKEKLHVDMDPLALFGVPWLNIIRHHLRDFCKMDFLKPANKWRFRLNEEGRKLAEDSLKRLRSAEAQATGKHSASKAISAVETKNKPQSDPEYQKEAQDRCQMLLEMYPKGLPLQHLLPEYERIFVETLDVGRLGFGSVEELVESWVSVMCLQEKDSFLKTAPKPASASVSPPMAPAGNCSILNSSVPSLPRPPVWTLVVRAPSPPPLSLLHRAALPPTPSQLLSDVLDCLAQNGGSCGLELLATNLCSKHLGATVTKKDLEKVVFENLHLLRFSGTDLSDEAGVRVTCNPDLFIGVYRKETLKVNMSRQVWNFQMKLAHYISPKKLFLVENENEGRLKILMEDIQNFFLEAMIRNWSEEKLSSSELEPGVSCAVRAPEGTFRRAAISALSLDRTVADIILVDSGRQMKVPPQALHRLPPNFVDALPAQGIHGCLVQVALNYVSGPKLDVVLLDALNRGGWFSVEVCGIQLNGVLLVQNIWFSDGKSLLDILTQALTM